MGYRAMFLCGDPAYYVRQGFRPAKEFGIRTADGMYAAALQACELYEGALCGLSGRYVEDPIYEVDIQAAEAFDQAFPPMEKQSGVKMQQRFLKIASMREAAVSRIPSETQEDAFLSHAKSIRFRPLAKRFSPL